MQCIFCHKDATTSTSVEHIVPESLGNKHTYLPKGYVCDACNHYFAIKIEKDLLNQPYFISLRLRNEILSKKNRLVKQSVIFPGAQKKSEISLQTQENTYVIHVHDEEVYNSIEEGKCDKMIMEYLPEPQYPNPLMSRFLAKCAYEFFLFNMGKENTIYALMNFWDKIQIYLKHLGSMQDLEKGNIGNTANEEFIPKVHFLSRKAEKSHMKYYMKCLFSLKIISIDRMVSLKLRYIMS
ncbi:HNH endonuclease [uncultured Alistipes sp.]|uniref:HNH endonuclease n=1 Tax=uncultured Alistipes sp. TaxID=538949 RepID=UPI00262CF619|nr:HNH endonuclease [uncultured Alistipes sp.]